MQRVVIVTKHNRMILFNNTLLEVRLPGSRNCRGRGSRAVTRLAFQAEDLGSFQALAPTYHSSFHFIYP